MVLELTTDAGSLFQWSTTLTMKCDQRAIVLFLCILNFIPLPHATDALFTSKRTSRLILSNLCRILKISIIFRLIPRLWRMNMSNYCNRYSYDKLRNVGIRFFARLCTLSNNFWSFIQFGDQNCIAYSSQALQMPYRVFSLLLALYDRNFLKLTQAS